MKKAIYASWCHVSSSKENNFHIHCPGGANSWCTYQADIVNGTSTHIHGKGLKPEIIKHVKSVFDDFSDETLLNRCLHGKTQNANEAFNGTIWNRIPKTRFIKYKQFQMAVHDAAAHFNIGNLATLLIYDKLDIERGYYTTTGCLENDNQRVKNVRRQSTSYVKTRRCIVRGLKKKKGDKTKKHEGTLYGPRKF